MKIVTNLKEFNIYLKTKINQVQKEEIMDEIAFYMENQMRIRFDNEEDYQGKKWEKLKYRTGKALNKTGQLKGSLGTATRVDNDTLAIFTNLKYAKLHDEGGIIVPKNKKSLKFKIGDKWYICKKITVPKRQFSGISEKNKFDMINILKKHFEIL